MSKIVINYDLIDEIYRAKGKHQIRLFLKENIQKYPWSKLYMAGNFIYDMVNNHLSDNYTPLSDMATTIEWVSICAVCIGLVDLPFIMLQRKILGINPQDEAFKKIQELSTIFYDNNIQTTPEFILNAYVYHKKYKLDMEHAPGVIRLRYINIPRYDYLGKEKETSILEEHKIGTKDYCLSLGEPEKKKVLRLAYGNS